MSSAESMTPSTSFQLSISSISRASMTYSTTRTTRWSPKRKSIWKSLCQWMTSKLVPVPTWSSKPRWLLRRMCWAPRVTLASSGDASVKSRRSWWSSSSSRCPSRSSSAATKRPSNSATKIIRIIVSRTLKEASLTTEIPKKTISRSCPCLFSSWNARQAVVLRSLRMTRRSIWSYAQIKSSRCTTRATYLTVWASPRLHLRSCQAYSTLRSPTSSSRINSWRLIQTIRSTLLPLPMPL